MGSRSLAAGTILFSTSLLNSKASSTRNGFNNVRLRPHKMSQALWEASRFTRRRPRGSAPPPPPPLWDERRWSRRRRDATLQGRCIEGRGAAVRLFFCGSALNSSSNSLWLDGGGALRFRPRPASPLESATAAERLFCSWCSSCFWAFSSYLQNGRTNSEFYFTFTTM